MLHFCFTWSIASIGYFVCESDKCPTLPSPPPPRSFLLCRCRCLKPAHLTTFIPCSYAAFPWRMAWAILLSFCFNVFFVVVFLQISPSSSFFRSIREACFLVPTGREQIHSRKRGARKSRPVGRTDAPLSLCFPSPRLQSYHTGDPLGRLNEACLTSQLWGILPLQAG